MKSTEKEAKVERKRGGYGRELEQRENYGRMSMTKGGLSVEPTTITLFIPVTWAKSTSRSTRFRSITYLVIKANMALNLNRQYWTFAKALLLGRK